MKKLPILEILFLIVLAVCFTTEIKLHFLIDSRCHLLIYLSYKL